MSPEDAIRSTLSAMRPGTVLLAAVSGGADSVAMLHLLVRATRAGFDEIGLAAAHLDHGLRGRESTEDARFVRDLGDRLGVPVVIGRARPTDALHSLEARARRVRYRFLRAAAKRRGAAAVLTAHTLEDQAETVLDRLLRGTGLRGLRGILPERALGRARDLRLLRPLLEVRRGDLRGWLTDRDLAWREDRTNRDGSNRRSRIRHELLPRVDEIGPGGAPALARMANRAREVWAVVRREAIRHERRAFREDERGPALSRRELRRCPEGLRWAVLERWLRRVGQEPRGLGETAIREAVRIATEGSTGQRFERPGRVSFRVCRRNLRPRRRP